MSSSKLERGVGLGLLCLVVGLGLALSFLREGDVPHPGSVASTEPEGRGALFALLTESGVPAREWREAPNQLPRKPALLWLPVVPSSAMPQAKERPFSRTEAPSRSGLHSLSHYLDFVEAGGTILMPAGEESTRFLTDELELSEAPETTERESGGSPVKRVTTGTGETIDVSLGTTRSFRPLDPNGTASALWTMEVDGIAQPFVVGIPVGAGTIALIANTDFVDNQHIGSADNALAAVRLVEELDHGGPVLFGEYELGRWESPSTVAMAFRPVTLLVTLHAIVLLVLLTWNRSFARAFPRDPEPHELFSALQRARSLSGVFERAGRYSGLGQMLRRSSFHRFEALAHVRVRLEPSSASPASTSPARVADAVDSPLAPVRIEEVQALARQAGWNDLEPRLAELLVGKRVARRADLDELDAQLRELETQIVSRLRARHRTSDDRATTRTDADGAESTRTNHGGHSRPTETP